MSDRRKFLSSTGKIAISIGLFLSPGLAFLQNALAKTRKLILPKNTKMADLIRKNPSNLDTSLLDPTPLNEFRTMGISRFEADMSEWRLKVKGLVKNPLNLTLTELSQLASIERDVLLICPGFFAQHGRWKGIDMLALLEKAGLDPAATDITFSSPAGLSKRNQTFALELVKTNQVFLAYGVNGEILPLKHGFPLRVVAKGAYGSLWTKYVDSIELISNQF